MSSTNTHFNYAVVLVFGFFAGSLVDTMQIPFSPSWNLEHHNDRPIFHAFDRFLNLTLRMLSKLQRLDGETPNIILIPNPHNLTNETLKPSNPDEFDFQWPYNSTHSMKILPANHSRRAHRVRPSNVKNHIK